MLVAGALWLRGSTLFALGQVALVALGRWGGALVPLAVVEVGLFGLVVADARTAGKSWLRPAVQTALAAGALGLLAWGAWHQFGLAGSVAVLALVVAVGSYGLHRYERLSLGDLDTS